ALEHLGIGEEGGRGAGLRRRLAALEVREWLPALVGLPPDVAIAPDLEVDALRQGVDHRHADAVQTTGDLVTAALAELAAGVQDGHDDLDGGASLLLHHRNGDPA